MEICWFCRERLWGPIWKRSNVTGIVHSSDIFPRKCVNTERGANREGKSKKSLTGVRNADVSEGVNSEVLVYKQRFGCKIRVLSVKSEFLV